MSSKGERKGRIGLVAQPPTRPKVMETTHEPSNAAERLLHRLVLSGLIRPRRQNLRKVTLKAPPSGPRAS
jgi:hypothetical protein